MKIYLVILIILSIAIVNAQDNEVVGRCMTGFNLNCAKCLWTQNADVKYINKYQKINYKYY